MKTNNPPQPAIGSTSAVRRSRPFVFLALIFGSFAACLAQTTITNVITGTISVPGERDVFTFNVAVDSRFYFDSLTNISTLQWSLTGPPGSLVANRSFASSDAQSIGDPTVFLPAGDYTLTIQDPNAATDGYAFRLVNLGEATLLIPGTVVTNNLSPANKSDFYQFNAVAGDQFYFQRIARVGLPNSYWRLLDPYGNQVFSQSFNDVGTPAAPITLPGSGTYTLLLEGYIGEPGSGSYAFNVVPEGHVTPPTFTGTPMSLGGLVASNLVTNTTNAYIFTLASPARVVFDTQTNSPGLNWTLQGPSGQVVNQRAINSSDWANNVGPLNLPAGNYQLRIQGGANGPYVFRLLDLATAISIVPGTSVTNTLNPASATTAYRFTLGSAGEYFFNYQSSSGLNNTYWRLLDPYGNTVFATSLSSDEGPLFLNSPGTYLLLVEGYFNDTGSGTNAFNLLPVADGLQALTVGNVVNGVIGSPGQQQQYTFTLLSSARLYFDSQTNASQLHWSLDGPAGNLVNNSGFNSDYGLGAVAAGTYTLTVSANNNSDVTGGYQFRLFNLATAAPLTPGTPVSDTLNPATSAKAYQFTLASAGKYFFDFQNSSGVPNAGWQLLDPKGAAVFNAGLGSDQGPLTLPAGTYTVLVAGYIFEAGSGTYTFNVVPVTDGSQVLALGSTVNGGITIPGQRQQYTFTLATPTRLYFDSQTNSSSQHWYLDGPTGNVVNNGSLNTDSILATVAPGNYTLTVFANNNNDATGGYQFRLFDLATAAPLTPGTPVSDPLSPANSARAYQFTAATPGKYFFNFQNSSGLPNASWQLLDSKGASIFNFGLASDAGPYNLVAGAYTLLVQGYIFDTGSGNFTLNVLPVSDGSQVLTPGGVVTSAIAAPGQAQRYTFTLAAPTRLYFDSLTNNGQLHWSLDGPTGNLVNNRSFPSSDAQSVATPVLPLSAGSYTLTVSANGDGMGGYQFRLFDLATATPLTPGTPVNDTLNPANSTVAYRFNVASAGKYFFNYQTSSGLNNTSWRLIDPDGVVVFGVGLFSDQGPLLLSKTGTYLVLVEGYVGDPGTGTYAFNVQPFTDGSQALTVGTMVSGTIVSPGQAQRYTFSLAGAARLYFDSLSNNGQLNWTLSGPTGNLVNNRSFTGSDAQAVGTPVLSAPAGSYTLSVSANGDNTGGFQFRLFDLATVAPLTPGTPVGNTLNPANSTVAYQFTAAAGDQFFFDYQSSSGLPNAYWRLIDPYSNVLFTRSFSSDAGTNTLAAAGIYLLLIEGYIGDPGTGSYGFNVQPVGNVPPGALTGTPLIQGNSIAGTLAAGTSTNSYTFSLATAARLYFDAMANNSFQWSLLGPGGFMVSNRSFQSSDGADISDPLLALPVGNYQLNITGQAGNYVFRLLNFTNAAALTPGTVVSNTLTPANGTVFYQFNGNAGDRYYFDGQTTSGFTYQPYTRIYGPLGNVIQTMNVNSDVDTFTLPQTGTYTLTVEGRVYDANASGTYAFNLVPESYPTNALVIGGVVSNTIPVPGQRQMFTFTLASAATLYFDALTNANFQWRLDAPWGQVIDWRGFAGSDSVDITDPALPLAGGSYTLTVAGSGFNTVGAYAFRLLNFANATTFTPGTVVSNTLAPANTTVFYRFNGNAGDRYYFDGQTTSGFTYQPYTRIYGPLGNVIQTMNVNSDVDTFTLPQTGTYTLTVEGRVYDANASGTYAFNLVPESYPTNALVVGNTVNGTIPVLGQRNGYTFTLASAATLYFDALTNANFQWRLDAPWGQVIDWRGFAGSDSVDITDPALPLAGGSYTLTVAGSGFNTVGAYAFRLLNFANATTFTPGTVVSNTLAPANTTVFYRFNGNAGDRYYFDGQTTSGFTYAPNCRLYAPLGNIFLTTTVSGDVDTFTLPQTGTYTLTVEGRVYDANASGTYAFNLVPESYPTNALVIGGVVSNTIPVPGQRQMFTFTLASAATLYFDALTNANFQWRLDAPAGQVVDWRGFAVSDSADTTDPALPLAGGSYTLTVAGSGFNTVGAYAFRLLNFANATTFTPGTVVSNTLAPANTTVFYRFNGNAGDRYYFDGQTTSGFTYQPYTRIYGPLGSVVQAVSVNSDVDTFSLPQTGTYTLTVEGRVYDTRTNGTYAFNLVPNPVEPPQPIFTTNLSSDLIVSSVTVTPPTGWQSGGSATMHWTDRNTGNGPTSGSFTDRVTIRNAAGLVLADTFLPYNEGDAGNGPIAGGASRNRQLAVTLPDGTNSVGTIQITVITDAQNGIAENNEANNSTSTSVNVSLAPYPDLLVGNLAATPPTAWQPGSVITINWRLTNSGAGIAGTNWADSVVVRNTNTALVIFNGTKSYNLADAGNGPVAAGGYRDRSLAFTMPTDASAYGAFAVTVMADSASQVFEYNAGGTAEANNATTTIVISAPDLAPTGLTVSSSGGSIRSGDTITVSWNDQNNGTVDASGGFSDRVVVVNTNTSETLLNTTVFYNPALPGNGPIPPGGSRPRSATLPLPDGPRGAGTLQITVTADTFSQLPEVNAGGTAEANNAVSATVVSAIAAYPDLQVINLNIQPGTLASGTNVTIQWQDTNSGNATVSANWYDHVTIVNTNTGVTLLDSTLYYNATALGPLTNGTARDRSYSFTLPDGVNAVGNLQFTITADTFNGVFEYNLGGTAESNNTKSTVVGASISPYPDLQVINLDVQPATLASGTNVTIRWQDSNAGNAPALGSWYNHVTVVNTGDGAPLLDTTVVYDMSVAGVLTNGTVRDRSYSFALPFTTNGAGNLRFSVTADTYNNLFEYNSGGTGENNNSNSVVRFSNLTPLPDLVVTGITVPGSALTDHAINAQFTVANLGTLAADGNIDQRVFVSSSPTPGSGTLAAVTAFNGPLAAGQGTNLSVTLQTPSVPGTYWLIVQTDGSDNVQELSEANNYHASATPFTVQPAYTAALTVDLHSALANTPIPMHGLATLGGTGLPAAFAPIKIHVLVRGTDRTYTVLTAADGTFTNVFYPLPNEAGNYQVAAAFPGVASPPMQDTFTLIGMSIAPVSLVNVIEATSITNTAPVNNLSDVPLTALSVTVVTNQPNLAVSASLETNTLAGFDTASLRIIVTALNASVFQSPVVLRVTSAEGATATLTVTVRVEALRPRLVTVPASLNGSMLRGTQTPLAFTLANQGGVPTGPLQVVLPNAPWFSLASSNQLPALPAGSNTVITLLLNPASDLPLGDYNGSLVVQSTNAGLSVPYSFRAVSAATGNLLVSAEDEYTYFVSGSPRVTNAMVVLSDALSRTPVVTNYTASDGTTLFTNLTEAFYIIDVSAPNHNSFRQSALVAAGSTTNVVAFLTRQTVHYSFTVVPTTVQDSYIFTVDSTFETQVPIPVVTIEPASIDLSPYPGTEFQVLLTISNHGLIDAESVKLNFRSTSRLQLTPLVSDLGKLKANTSLTVPVMVKRIPPPPTTAKAGLAKQDSSSGECSVTGDMLWSYLCGPSVVDKDTAVYAFDSTGCDLPALFREVYHLVPDAGTSGGGGVIGSDDFFDYLESLNPVTDFEAPAGYHFECNASPPAPFTGSAVKSRVTALARQDNSPRKQADNSVCSRVRLRLDQKGVLTRDAFKATLEIDNDVPSPLQNVRVDLVITGESGTQVNTNFAITPAALSGLTAVDGTGTLAGNSVGTANWTLIPTLDAAPTNGVALYLVGGTLRYTQDGSDLTVPLGPTPIQVFPQPELVVRYFHDRDVFSDDPFTPAIEPSIPYSLVAQVNNVGYGAAQALTITSGKPQILENVKGLLIDFTILGAQLENQLVTPALDVNFGQIAAGTNKIARWLFTSSIQGSFTNFSASFKQVDQFGKPRLSLVRSVEIHELTHIVAGNGPLEDGRPDLLVNDVPDPDFLPDTIYLSDGSTNVVAAVTNADITGTLGAGNLSVIAAAAAPAGWSYFRFRDPGQGQYRLTKVLRNNGSEIPLGTNVWTTDRSMRGGSLVPIRTNLVHVLDYNSAGSYTLFYVPVNTTNDTIAPSSVVAALPTGSPPYFTVQWSGADGTGGSGVSLYDIYVSINGGAFAPWITNTTLTAAIYGGVTNNLYAFYSRATDAAGNTEAAPASADAQTTISAPGNTSPIMAPIPPQSVAEGALFSLFPNATDADVPAQTLTWRLLPGSPNAALFSSVNGHITWQTGPADNGNTSTFTLVVTDNGSPSLSATQSFNVVVIHTNHAPVIVSPAPQLVVDEQAPMSLQLTAIDSDVSDVLTWEWASAVPAGLNFNPATGLLTWTPGETQGPGSYVARVIVRDNGTPRLSDTNTFTILVNESNRPPVLSTLGSQTAFVLEPLILTYTATDPDVPANSLHFSLGTGAPAHATINPTNGVFSWPPPRNLAGSTNTITVVVTDDGVPPLSASNTLTVVVGQYAEATLGSALVEAGQAGSVSLTIGASTPVTNISFTLDVSSSGLTNFSLAAPAPPLASATLQQITPGQFQVTLRTLAGQSLLGNQTVSTLSFTARSNAPSDFVRLQISNVSAKQSNGSALPRTLSTDGHVTLVNVEPLLVARLASGGRRDVTLFGAPGLSYQLQYSTDLSSPGNWRDWMRVPMTNLSQVIEALNPGTLDVFFRAYEFKANPPIINAAFNGSQTGLLTLYGQPGVSYQLQYKSNLSTGTTWGLSLTYTPTNSFYFLNNVSASNPAGFYRIFKP